MSREFRIELEISTYKLGCIRKKKKTNTRENVKLHRKGMPAGL